LSTHDPLDPIDRALGRLDQALSKVDAERLDSVIAVLDQLTELNELLGTGQVPPERFAGTRARVDRAMCGLNTLLDRLSVERDQVSAALASLTPRLRRCELFRHGAPHRRFDVTN